jgi:hypothetical protein
MSSWDYILHKQTLKLMTLYFLLTMSQPECPDRIRLGSGYGSGAFIFQQYDSQTLWRFPLFTEKYRLLAIQLIVIKDT